MLHCLFNALKTSHQPLNVLGSKLGSLVTTTTTLIFQLSIIWIDGHHLRMPDNGCMTLAMIARMEV